MKTQKCKQLFPNIADFLFLTIILGIFTLSIYGVRLLLFSDTQEGGQITIVSESLPERFESELSVDDILFDTLTKRRVGEITELKKVSDGEGRVKFIISLNADFIPRSQSLRTKRLWFEYVLSDGRTDGSYVGTVGADSSV